ncbi:hypothetical protein NE237_017886 [Protea cynaroides]|uniref:Uncharacterized protein n=1 Tax=Protea cynaroides TaxID=273540 RepID=A0A9Q0K8W0_9MAGN|nr:hypothetical protein NE237_017886 [Protea cynaroides]
MAAKDILGSSGAESSVTGAERLHGQVPPAYDPFHFRSAESLGTGSLPYGRLLTQLFANLGFDLTLDLDTEIGVHTNFGWDMLHKLGLLDIVLNDEELELRLPPHPIHRHQPAKRLNARASEFVELRDLLADARSLVTTLDDHQRSLQTRLDTHKSRMLQNIAGVEQRVIVVEWSIIQLQSLEEATMNKVTFLWSALAGIVPWITDDIVAIVTPRRESYNRRRQAVALTRATFSVDSPRSQADHGSQESDTLSYRVYLCYLI